MPKHGIQLCNDYEPRKHPKNAIAEVKFDGLMALVENGKVYGRRHKYDITYQFPEIRVDPALVVLGEIVIEGGGLDQFHLVQMRNVENPTEIRLRSQANPATLMVFDILEADGRNLEKEPLSKRRENLESLKLRLENDHVQVAGFWGCPPEKVPEYLDMMRGQNAEGIIVKNLDAGYWPTRNDGWLKLKAWKEGTYEILGFDVTENLGFVVYIENKGYKQKVVVNNVALAERIRQGKVQQLLIRYLDEELSHALRQPHVVGVPWTN